MLFVAMQVDVEKEEVFKKIETNIRDMVIPLVDVVVAKKKLNPPSVSINCDEIKTRITKYFSLQVRSLFNSLVWIGSKYVPKLRKFTKSVDIKNTESDSMSFHLKDEAFFVKNLSENFYIKINISYEQRKELLGKPNVGLNKENTQINVLQCFKYAENDNWSQDDNFLSFCLGVNLEETAFCLCCFNNWTKNNQQSKKPSNKKVSLSFDVAFKEVVPNNSFSIGRFFLNVGILVGSISVVSIIFYIFFATYGPNKS